MRDRIERAFHESIAAKVQFLKEHRATLETVGFQQWAGTRSCADTAAFRR